MPSLLHAQSELLWGQGRDPWFEWVVAGVRGLPSSAAGGRVLEGDRLELEGSSSGDPQGNAAVLLDYLALAKRCCLL